ncbi:dTTP/UTP pyrophosphatase [Eubacterium plexicaudatum ASF492]|uniref:dTTP/UTP pyrophosphatase n=1 Tax=Eubacterium plexicaudatum ASF492 TaxID=1235802 RepID=N2A1M5_9FIRM|nr:dTTP/UTP pyrophosphatase [Eubacterium plexicaudatum ASF492]
MRIILASASPRRKELLAQLFSDFEIIPAQGSEVYTKQIPSEIVQQLSAQKAAEVEQAVTEDADYLVIGADTVVALKNRILGKPKDASDAERMLRMLSGAVHQVYTGVAIHLMCKGHRRCIEFAECTNVRFYPMTEQEIRDYVCSGEPMDKAGAYGIQGIGGRFVQGIEGDYANVVGLPVAKLYQILKKIEEIALPF